MPIDIKVPPLPESVADATVLDWHHQAGDRLKRDEKLVDLETDKVVLEVVAPHAGILTTILKPSGETVNSDEVLAVFEPDDDATANDPSDKGSAATKPATPAPPPPAPPTAAQDQAATRKPEQPPTPPPTQPAASSTAPSLAENRPPPGPAARRLLEQHGLDASLVPGSGPKGRITKGDVLSFMAGDAHQTVPAHNNHSNGQLQRPADNVDAPEPLPFPETDSPPTASRSEQRVAMTRLRRRIAERLVDAQHSAAMLTTFNEVDMLAVKQLRARHRDAFQQQHGIKLGFMSFFVKAVLQALAHFPIVNASIDGDDIIYHGYYDIGIAVSTPSGLVVPIIRDAEQLSFAGIEQAITDLASRARDRKLSIDDLTGGTFSITNGGTFGSLLSTPILNPPQTAILGMHSIQDRPVAVDGQVVIRPIMYLALSYDHRLVDGADAVRFLVTVKQALEDPTRLLLDL